MEFHLSLPKCIRDAPRRSLVRTALLTCINFYVVDHIDIHDADQHICKGMDLHALLFSLSTLKLDILPDLMPINTGSACEHRNRDTTMHFLPLNMELCLDESDRTRDPPGGMDGDFKPYTVTGPTISVYFEIRAGLIRATHSLASKQYGSSAAEVLLLAEEDHLPVVDGMAHTHFINGVLHYVPKSTTSHEHERTFPVHRVWFEDDSKLHVSVTHKAYLKPIRAITKQILREYIKRAKEAK